MSEDTVCPIWKAIIQNVSYQPHPWDIAREGTLTGVDNAVVAIREHFAARGWQPIETAPNMFCVLLRHDYYSHGRVRHGYQNQKGQWVGVNANGTEGELNFEPTGWMHLPGDERTHEGRGS